MNRKVDGIIKLVFIINNIGFEQVILNILVLLQQEYLFGAGLVCINYV